MQITEFPSAKQQLIELITRPCKYVFSPNVLHTHIWNPRNFCFVLFWCFFFQLHRDRGVKGGYQVLSWNESQTQIIHALSTLSFNRLQYIYS